MQCVNNGLVKIKTEKWLSKKKKNIYIYISEEFLVVYKIFHLGGGSEMSSWNKMKRNKEWHFVIVVYGRVLYLF